LGRLGAICPVSVIGGASFCKLCHGLRSFLHPTTPECEHSRSSLHSRIVILRYARTSLLVTLWVNTSENSGLLFSTGLRRYLARLRYASFHLRPIDGTQLRRPPEIQQIPNTSMPDHCQVHGQIHTLLPFRSMNEPDPLALVLPLSFSIIFCARSLGHDRGCRHRRIYTEG
jgi:hypothetical protein